MDDFLYRHVMMNYPYLREEDIEEAIEINEYDLLIKFKNGKKIIFDTFANKEYYITYESENLTDEEMNYEFRRNLRNMMNRKRISQEELAERVGVSQGMISNYVRGSSIPDSIMLKKIARVLNCSTEDFYYKHY